jgi:hypothetical protein
MIGRQVFMLGFSLAFVAVARCATPSETLLDRATLARMSHLKQGDALTIAAFPVGAGSLQAIRFERAQIYADSIAPSADTKTVARSTRIYMRGYSDDGATKVALSLNADSSFAEGIVLGPQGTFSLQAAKDSLGGSKLTPRSLNAMTQGFKFDFRCSNDLQNMEVHTGEDLLRDFGKANSSAATVTSTHALRLATILVDTDSLFMSKLFANDTAAAANWIAGLFNVTNLMYERDLLVRFYVGSTTLRTNPATDPYNVVTFVPGATTAQLNFFADHWKNDSTTRQFSILLSGQEPGDNNSCSFSGIAWINQYCKKGTVDGLGNTVGSYSVNQVCTSTNPFFGPAFSALGVAHEIGHNLGAWHTHCTDTTNGNAPVATNTIDTCFNLEAPLGCYAGAQTSCPSSGPGAPAGTIMSYCNQILQCGTDGQNVLQFHPTHVAKLNTIIAGQGACLNETDGIFFSAFE